MDNKERYSQRSFYSDITGRLEIIRIDFKKEFNPRINNFLNNNCYPVFVEDAEEVILLMNDYNAFIMGVYGVELTLSSFSKILIPFFELDEQDIQGISKEKPDLLPF